MKNAILITMCAFICFFATAQYTNKNVGYSSKKPQFGFIENRGQIHDQNYNFNSDVKYLLCLGNGMNIQLKNNSFSYDTYKTTIKDKKSTQDKVLPNEEIEKETSYYFHRVDVELVGANENPQIIVKDPSPDYLNFYNAITHENGVTGVRNYKKITYINIYPGIDMEFVAQPSNEKPVEYNFIVHPGADAKLIRLHYIGANQTQLLYNKININIAQGNFTESIPSSWIKETNNKLNITYDNIDKDIYGFDIPSYLKSNTLIIDPTPNLEWGTYYGGDPSTINEIGKSIACDAYGNIYVTGRTSATNTIATIGAHQDTLGGEFNDAYIVKFNNSGVRQWGTYYGGSGDEFGFGISLDINGNIFITGRTSSINSIATLGSYQIASGGGSDAFIAKFNNNGVRQWGTYYGASGNDYGTGITCDNNGNVFVVGGTGSIDSIATAGSHKDSLNGYTDAFLVKFNNNGVCQWATYYGGNNYDYCNAVACDFIGNLYVTGSTVSVEYISTIGAHQTMIGGAYGSSDAFLVKFNNNGVRQWGTYYGGSNNDVGTGITVDGSSNVLIIGYTKSLDSIATIGAHQTTYGGNEDAFVAKFNSNGVRQWGTYYGGSQMDYGYGIVCGTYDNVFITGGTNSTNAIATNNTYQNAYGGGPGVPWFTFGDVFLAKFDNNGQIQWGTYYGGSKNEYGYGITIDSSGYLFITGPAESTNAIVTAGAHQTTFIGIVCIFVAKFSSGTSSILNNNSTISSFAVYPNPVSDELIIENTGNINTVGFEILNSLGQIIFKGNLTGKALVHTTNFASGIYIIKLENGKGFEFKKIVKE